MRTYVLVRLNSVTLRVGPVAVDVHDSAPIGIVPMIDGSSLVDLVSRYETSRGWEPAGGYDGLVPRFHDYGNLTAYYLGANHAPGLGPSRIQVLGCTCGDAGCWPLQTTIDILPTMVTWSDFTQPHRPEWEYSTFGPFTFDRDAYETAVHTATRQLAEDQANRTDG